MRSTHIMNILPNQRLVVNLSFFLSISASGVSLIFPLPTLILSVRSNWSKILHTSVRTLPKARRKCVEGRAPMRALGKAWLIVTKGAQQMWEHRYGMVLSYLPSFKIRSLKIYRPFPLPPKNSIRAIPTLFKSCPPGCILRLVWIISLD
jgi:hypothetical protein